jgi:hypothetical protein
MFPASSDDRLAEYTQIFEHCKSAAVDQDMAPYDGRAPGIVTAVMEDLQSQADPASTMAVAALRVMGYFVHHTRLVKQYSSAMKIRILDTLISLLDSRKSKSLGIPPSLPLWCFSLLHSEFNSSLTQLSRSEEKSCILAMDGVVKKMTKMQVGKSAQSVQEGLRFMARILPLLPSSHAKQPLPSINGSSIENEWFPSLISQSRQGSTPLIRQRARQVLPLLLKLYPLPAKEILTTWIYAQPHDSQKATIPSQCREDVDLFKVLYSQCNLSQLAALLPLAEAAFDSKDDGDTLAMLAIWQKIPGSLRTQLPLLKLRHWKLMLQPCWALQHRSLAIVRAMVIMVADWCREEGQNTTPIPLSPAGKGNGSLDDRRPSSTTSPPIIQSNPPSSLCQPPPLLLCKFMQSLVGRGEQLRHDPPHSSSPLSLQKKKKKNAEAEVALAVIARKGCEDIMQLEEWHALFAREHPFFWNILTEWALVNHTLPQLIHLSLTMTQAEEPLPASVVIAAAGHPYTWTSTTSSSAAAASSAGGMAVFSWRLVQAMGEYGLRGGGASMLPFRVWGIYLKAVLSCQQPLPPALPPLLVALAQAILSPSLPSSQEGLSPSQSPSPSSSLLAVVDENRLASLQRLCVTLIPVCRHPTTLATLRQLLLLPHQDIPPTVAILQQSIVTATEGAGVGEVHSPAKQHALTLPTPSTAIPPSPLTQRLLLLSQLQQHLQERITSTSPVQGEVASLSTLGISGIAGKSEKSEVVEETEAEKEEDALTLRQVHSLWMAEQDKWPPTLGALLAVTRQPQPLAMLLTLLSTCLTTLNTGLREGEREEQEEQAEVLTGCFVLACRRTLQTSHAGHFASSWSSLLMPCFEPMLQESWPISASLRQQVCLLLDQACVSISTHIRQIRQQWGYGLHRWSLVGASPLQGQPTRGWEHEQEKRKRRLQAYSPPSTEKKRHKLWLSPAAGEAIEEEHDKEKQKENEMSGERHRQARARVTRRLWDEESRERDYVPIVREASRHGPRTAHQAEKLAEQAGGTLLPHMFVSVDPFDLSQQQSQSQSQSQSIPMSVSGLSSSKRTYGPFSPTKRVSFAPTPELAGSTEEKQQVKQPAVLYPDLVNDGASISALLTTMQFPKGFRHFLASRKITSIGDLANCPTDDIATFPLTDSLTVLSRALETYSSQKIPQS